MLILKVIPMIIQRLHEFPDRAIEWLLGFMLLSWGVILAGNPDIFQTSKLYAGWQSILGDEFVWGWAAICCGLARLGALFVNGAWSRTPVVRVITSFASMFLWFWVVVGMLRVEVSTGLGIYPWLMFGEAFSVYRASGDAFEAHYRRRMMRSAMGAARN
jgi:hypothetical protein